MHLAELRRHTHTEEPLSPELWAEASILGMARMLVRDKDRQGHRDRGGALRNSEVDLMGAMGEILLYTAVERCAGGEAALAHMRGHLFVNGKAPPVGDPDLDFKDDGAGERRIRIDAKTFDCSLQQPSQPGRPPYENRLFAINKKKHDGLRGNCEFYHCSLFGRFGRRAAISRLVSYPEVETDILVRPFGWRENGPPTQWFICDIAGHRDPSHNLFVTAFISQNFEPGRHPAPRALRASPFSEDEVRRALASVACQRSVVAKAPQLAAVLGDVLEELGVQPLHG